MAEIEKGPPNNPNHPRNRKRRRDDDDSRSIASLQRRREDDDSRTIASLQQELAQLRGVVEASTQNHEGDDGTSLGSQVSALTEDAGSRFGRNRTRNKS